MPARHTLKRIALPFCLMLGMARAQEAPAPAEPGTVPYTIEITTPEGSDLGDPLRASSQLVQLRERAPTSALGVIGRTQADLPRLDAVLRSEGYYASRILVSVDGRPPDAPNLVEQLQPGRSVPIRITVEPGPRYTMGRILVRAAGTPMPSPEAREAVAEAADRPFGIAEGDPARAAAVLDAESTLVERLRQSGHPFAAAAPRDAVVDHNTRTMDVTYVLAPGPVANFARPLVTGQTRVSTALLDHIAGRITDRQFSPLLLDRTRRQLNALGVFDSVQARAAERLDESGRLPVTFVVEERKRRALGFTAAYETNFGPTGQVYWEHRNLFGGAERLRLEAEVSRLGSGGGTSRSNFRTTANLRFPNLFNSDYALVTEISYLRQRLEAYDRDAVAGSALLERRITDQLVLQGGPTFDIGRTGRDGNWTSYSLVGVQLGARYDSTDNPLNPTRGIKAGANVTPYYELRGGETFVRMRLDASTYFDLWGDTGSIVAVRGALGSVPGADRDALPYHMRYYAGGGGSVRGYDFQSIGPRDSRNRPLGGASLVEASVELRQRIRGPLGMALFVDAGAVGDNPTPTFSNLRVGAGAGVRYLTPIGPIRADFALPLQKQEGSSGYGIYVGLGQAF
ncbi:autotransporter assembly complex protein TamA [Roseomonas acroporae]|uniref:autotransporter assembly complex protein TamA n=1 Tax=Roseomonas acroporae TaxID=2937791 RepID=UPI00200AF83D